MKRFHRSTTLDVYVLESFIPVFLVAMTFFVLILEMADVLVNIVQYIQNDAPLSSVVRAAILYAPRCVSWSLPISMLFAVSFVLGNMFANNELMVVYGSGIHLGSFMLPVFVFAAVLSVGFLLFEDAVVVPTYAAKKQLGKAMLRTGEAPAGENDVTILGQGGRFVWNIRYFDKEGMTMTGVTVVERDDAGDFAMRINAQSATWLGDRWRFNGVRRFYWNGDSLTDESLGTWENADYREPPDSFRGRGKPVDEMSLADAGVHIAFLKRAGLPSSSQEAEYLRRYSYALTPLLVSLLSAALAGRFKKNILLMSLLVSLVGATLYYVTQMISMLLAKNEVLSPVIGAFTPLAIFLALVIMLF
ncbi:MAG: YjgP/YjgQ family permease, partial [Spirochaetales bacterium]